MEAQTRLLQLSSTHDYAPYTEIFPVPDHESNEVGCFYFYESYHTPLPKRENLE